MPISDRHTEHPKRMENSARVGDDPALEDTPPIVLVRDRGEMPLCEPVVTALQVAVGNNSIPDLSEIRHVVGVRLDGLQSGLEGPPRLAILATDSRGNSSIAAHESRARYFSHTSRSVGSEKSRSKSTFSS